MNDVEWSDEEIKENDKKEKAFKIKLKHELLKSEDRRRRHELYEVRHQNRIYSDRKKKLTTTKILMYFILLNCTIIEAYSMWVMYVLQDLSALYSLIGAVVGEALSYAVYCAKSFNDTKEECKSKLERDKFEAEFNSSSSEDSDDLPPDDIPQDDDHSGDIPPGEEEVPEN